VQAVTIMKTQGAKIEANPQPLAWQT